MKRPLRSTGSSTIRSLPLLFAIPTLFAVVAFAPSARAGTALLDCLCTCAIDPNGRFCGTAQSCFHNPEPINASPSCNDPSRGECVSRGFGCGRTPLERANEPAARPCVESCQERFGETPTRTRTSTRTRAATSTRTRTATRTRTRATPAARTPTRTATAGSGSGECCAVNDSPGCNQSACQACVCSLDEDCCDSDFGWDGFCFETAVFDCEDECACNPEPNDCCAPQFEPGCAADACESCVCGLDSDCCDPDYLWDGFCVDLAADECNGQCQCSGGPVTATPTRTRTASRTPTRTRTPSHSATPSHTRAPTVTATSTRTPTPTPTATMPIPPRVERIDLVQAVAMPAAEHQPYLVAGKSTYVRVFVRNLSPAPLETTAQLHGNRAGQTLPGSPRSAERRTIRLDPGPIPDEGELDRTFNFALPSSWTAAGRVDLRVELLPAQTSNSNADTLELNFQIRDLTVFHTQIAGEGQSFASIDQGLVAGAAGLLRQTYPATVTYRPFSVARANAFTYCDGGPNKFLRCFADSTNCPEATCAEEGWHGAMRRLLRNTPLAGPDVLFGWIPGSGCSGHADRETPGRRTEAGVRKLVLSPNAYHTAGTGCNEHGLAHEVGHLKLLEHPHNNSRSAANSIAFAPSQKVPPLFVEGDPTVDERVINTDNGLELRTAAGSRDDFEFMWQTSSTSSIAPVERNNDNVWISRSSWKWMFGMLSRSRRGATGTTAPVDSFPYLTISGLISADGDATILSVLPGAAQLGTDDGPYCLDVEQRAAGGDAVTTSRCFSIAAADDDEQPFALIPFVESVPRAGKPLGATLSRDDVFIAAIEASANEPTVEILEPMPESPLSGTRTIAWRGLDADGDDLVYDVLYSADGGASWLPLAAELSETSLVVATDNLPGSEDAWIRVVVGDGVSFGEDEVGPFQSPNKPPAVAIAAPVGPGPFAAGASLLLVAEAYDVESAIRVFWESDRDGALGEGNPLSVSDLSTGLHLITAEAADDDGNSTFDSIEIEIGGSCPGDCDGNGQVAIAEMIVGVNLALGRRDLSDCPAFDGNGDGRVTISELIAAVRAALDGCDRAG